MIGTNKKDAADTVARILEDEAGSPALGTPPTPTRTPSPRGSP